MAEQVGVVVTIDISEELLDELRAVSPRLSVAQRPCRSESDASRALDPSTEVLYSRYQEKIPVTTSAVTISSPRTSGAILRESPC